MEEMKKQQPEERKNRINNRCMKKIKEFLIKLFDYQKFEDNLKLKKVINEIDDKEYALSDDSLFAVSGGQTRPVEFEEDNKEKKSNQLFLNLPNNSGIYLLITLTNKHTIGNVIVAATRATKKLYSEKPNLLNNMITTSLKKGL